MFQFESGTSSIGLSSRTEFRTGSEEPVSVLELSPIELEFWKS